MSKPLLWELNLSQLWEGSFLEPRWPTSAPAASSAFSRGLGLIFTNSSEELGKGTAGTACEFNSATNGGCLTDSQLLIFVVQVEDAKIFLNENISANSEVFEPCFAFLSEMLSGSVKLDITDIKKVILSFSFLYI